MSSDKQDDDASKSIRLGRILLIEFENGRMEIWVDGMLREELPSRRFYQIVDRRFYGEPKWTYCPDEDKWAEKVPSWFHIDHMRVGSIVETYIHISRVRPLTEQENQSLSALTAWSDNRVTIVRAASMGASHDMVRAAAEELGRAPIPSPLPLRPGSGR